MAINRPRSKDVRSTDPQGPLECALIDEFLADRGHTLQSVDKLPPAERRELLRRAASYATLRRRLPRISKRSIAGNAAPPTLARLVTSVGATPSGMS